MTPQELHLSNPDREVRLVVTIAHANGRAFIVWDWRWRMRPIKGDWIWEAFTKQPWLPEWHPNLPN